jgi:hypothetical protein
VGVPSFTINHIAAPKYAVSFGFSADPDGRRDVLEIRFDSTIVYSALTGIVVPWLKWRFYPGTETQEPDPLAVLMQGTAATAYRGQMIIFFEDVPSTMYDESVELDPIITGFVPLL